MICSKIPLENELPLETHHIEFQSKCDKNGFTENKPHIKKNDKVNLCVLCHDCHVMIDKPVNNKQLKIYGYNETLEGVKLDYEIIINKNTIKNNTQEKIILKKKIRRKIVWIILLYNIIG